MALRLTGHIDLPAHVGAGGFDHAAIHHGTRRLYVAHTANSAVDVIDCQRQVHEHSIDGLPAVQGVFISEERGLAFTSNRGADTVSMFEPGRDQILATIPVGVAPNGLAFDPGRGTLLAANLGDPGCPESFTLSVVDVAARAMTAAVPVPGRTRWTVYDPATDCFFVNISDPARIVVLDAANPGKIARTYDVPSRGPHGLDVDGGTGRVYCACDSRVMVALDAATGRVLGEAPLSGTPDVVWLDRGLQRVYVAVGDPGVIDVIDVAAMKRAEIVPTEAGAHTTALDVGRHLLYVFLPRSHRAAVFVDE